MSIKSADVEESFEANGFRRTHRTKKVVEYQSITNGKYIYFRTEIGLPEFIRVVVHPEESLTTLTAHGGTIINTPKDLQHGSNMTRFPKRKHTGVDEIHFGKALNVASLLALNTFAKNFHAL